MTGAGGGHERPRPARGPGGGWVPGPRQPSGPQGPRGPQGGPGAGRPSADEAQPRDALDAPLDFGDFDESAEPADDGIVVGSPPPDDPGHDVLAGHILGDVAAIERQRDEYLGALQQLQADFENYRKRVQRQHHEESAKAALDLVTKLLPVLDTLDLAEAHLGAAALEGAVSEGAVSEEAKALGQARGQLLAVLAAEGLERVDEAEVVFDPVVHDAVAGEAGSGNDEMMIDEVLRSGYRWRGRVLRPAMVRVRS